MGQPIHERGVFTLWWTIAAPSLARSASIAFLSPRFAASIHSWPAGCPSPPPPPPPAAALEPPPARGARGCWKAGADAVSASEEGFSPCSKASDQAVRDGGKLETT